MSPTRFKSVAFLYFIAWITVVVLLADNRIEIFVNRKVGFSLQTAIDENRERLEKIQADILINTALLEAIEKKLKK
jgi:hypothetical protein